MPIHGSKHVRKANWPFKGRMVHLPMSNVLSLVSVGTMINVEWWCVGSLLAFEGSKVDQSVFGPKRSH